MERSFMTLALLDVPSPGDIVGGVAGSAASSISNSAIDKFAEAVSHAVGESVKGVATIWTQVPTVGLGSGGTASKLQDNLYWYVGFAAVLSVLIAGGRMAWEARAQPLRDLGQSLIRLVVVTGAGLAVLRLAVESGDAFSVWMIGQSGGESFDKKMTAMLTAVTVAGGPVGSVLIIVVGLILVVASLGQIVLMIARSGMLVLLAGILPLSAAATNTEWGHQWFQKTTGWMIAFVLYKPAAAIVYAAAFELFGDSKDLVGALTVMTMMNLAIATLPALMKLCVPLVGGLAGGEGGGGAMMAAGMAGSGMGGGPTGAKDVPPQTPASFGSPGSGGGSPMGAAPTAGGGPGAAAGTGGGAAAAGGGAAAAAGPAGAGIAAAQAGSALMERGSQAAEGAVGNDTNDGGPDGSQ
jgi:type IV secretion system protein TrbL